MKVICKKTGFGLTVGEYYEVAIGQIGPYPKYIIYNKSGQGTFYEMDVFQSVDEIRKEKIDQILDRD